jgi:hypothetical protein
LAALAEVSSRYIAAFRLPGYQQLVIPTFGLNDLAAVRLQSLF